MFVSRYVTCLMIFVLGLKAPGLVSQRDYFDMNDPLHLHEEVGTLAVEW